MARTQTKKSQKQILDIDAIRQAATGRWIEILQSVGGIPSSSLDGRHHPCPRCGGTDRFRLIDRAAGSVLCGQCFRSKNGDGFAAIQWARGLDFLSAAREVAEHLGIECGHVGQSRKKLAVEQLSFRPWNDTIATLWCRHKRPITPDALQAVGAKIARYMSDNVVIAIPVWGEQLTESDPVGWVLYNSTGGTLPVYQNGEIVDQVKVKTLAGSRAGLMGSFATGRSAPGLTIKTEGPSDMLALLGAGPLDGETICCNVHGCGEDPRKTPWLGEFFEGRDVVVIGDNDRPGQDGAKSWARFAAVTAAAARVVQLPGPIADSHGSDLRDFLLRNNRDALDELINQAAVVEPDEGTRAVEAKDDPHRLARVNLERYAGRNSGRTIRHWNGSWWTWKNCRYRHIDQTELQAKLTASIKEEFDRLNVEEQKQFLERREAGLLDDDDKPPVARKVTPQIVSAVLNATRGMVYLSGECSLDTWVPDRRRRNYLSMANGILDIDALLADKELDEVLLPHSPEWFSTVHLPYEFDPNAECPQWEAFLRHNLEGDHERIAVLQEWAGYLLLPDTDHQRFLILEGEGSNGKSVFCAAIEAMVGRANCSHVQFEVFGDRFSKTETLGKLVNICGDAGEIDAVAEGILKAFTSGNTMMFDRKNLSPIMAQPTARLMIACNNLPRFRDRSQGIWRRAMIAPWRVKIEDAEKVQGMDKATWWEESGELPGMLRWALIGLARLREQGQFSSSVVMEMRKEEYQVDTNPARQFLQETLEPAAAGSPPIKCRYLYQAYRRWALESGYHPLSDRAFGQEVRRAFIRSERRRFGSRADRCYCYLGVDYQAGALPAEDSHDARHYGEF